VIIVYRYVLASSSLKKNVTENNKNIHQWSADEVFTSNELTVLRRKISVLECLIDKNKKQTTLDSFFEKW